MKKLKAKRMLRISCIAFGILAIVITICAFVNPIAAIGAPVMAFGLMVAGIELTPEQEKTYNAMLEGIRKEMDKNEKGYISETKMNELIGIRIKEFTDKFGESELIKELTNSIKGEVQEQLDKIGIAVKALEENGNGPKKSKWSGIVEKLVKGFKDQVAGHKTETFVEEQIEATKVAGTETTSNLNVTNIGYAPAVQTIPGVIDLVLPKQTIMDLVTVQTISKPTLAWVEETAQDGNATWIGEGVIKALVDWDFKTMTETAKKIASRVKFTEEAIDDLDFMSGALNRLQNRDLERKLSTAVLSATKSSTSIGGIATMASSYTITALNDTVLRPNLYEVCNALNAQVTALGFVGKKSVVVNSYDWAIAKSEKDSMYRNMDVSERIMREYTVIEDPEIPQGYILFGELSYFTVMIYKNAGIRLGYSTGDWEYNMMSAIAEKRLLTMLPDNYVGAIIYDAIGTVKAAIELEEA